MIKILRAFAVVLLVLISALAYAQKPNISYQTPQVYKVGTAITLTPSNTGGAVDPIQSVVVAVGLSNPTSVAQDATGTLYVTANGSNTVVKITPAGKQIVIGSGFNQPTGVAVDAAGNAYVADYGNNAIKKVPANGGKITTVGFGFDGPYGIAIDKDGMLYISDRANNVIKKVPATGGTPVIIGSGFNTPTGIAVDNDGNVYVTDRGNNLIRKIVKTTGQIVTIGPGDGNPNGIAVDAAGNVYYADTNNASLKEYPAGGKTSIVVATGFSLPTGVAVTGNTIIYVDDNGSSQIKKFIPGAAGYTINQSLPAGLIFDPNTGIINGTPTTVVAATDYVITAANKQGTSSATVNIRVKLPVAPILSYKTPQVFAFKTTITPVEVTNKGGAMTYPYYHVTPQLPSGLYLNSNTGEITGTPQAGSPATDYTVSASNPGGTGSTVINIAVTPPPKPAISYTTPVTATLGVNTGYIPANAGGPIDIGGYTVSPALPAGLAIDSFSGTINGTPSAAQAAKTYKVIAKNSGGSSSANIVIAVV